MKTPRERQRQEEGEAKRKEKPRGTRNEKAIVRENTAKYLTK